MTHPAPFAQAALDELEQRRARYPDAIAEGKIAKDEAEADLAAWTAIEALLRTGSCDAAVLEAMDGDVSMPSAWWRRLESAAARAVAARSEAARARPEDEGRVARLRAVEAIHRRMASNLAWCVGQIDTLAEGEAA